MDPALSFVQGVHGSFGVILADPPWAFTTRSPKGKGRSAEAYYDTMSLDDIKALPVQGIAAEDCVLFLWATDPLLDKAMEVISAWGFTYKTVGFYWAKAKVAEGYGDWWTGNQMFPMGMGYWTRANPEICLLATRGHPKPQAHDVRRLIVAPRREHSRKPDEVYDRIERLCTGPYIELFARQRQPGWDAWGNQVETGPADRRWKSTSNPEENPDEPQVPQRRAA